MTHNNKPTLGMEAEPPDTMCSLQSVKDVILVGDGALLGGEGSCACERVQRLGRHLRLEKVVGHEVEEEPAVVVRELKERLRHFARGQQRHAVRGDGLVGVKPVERVYHMVL